MLWKKPPLFPTIAKNQVDIWKCYLNPSVKWRPGLLSLLSEDEKNRAKQYALARDSHSFIVSRSVLRIILSLYSQISIHEIRIGYGEYGKPYFKNDMSLQFNLSHASEIALYAFTRDLKVGIDLENIKTPLAMDAVISYYFTDKEKEIMKAQPQEMRIYQFLKIWTIKESLMKAEGKGICGLLTEYSNWSTFCFQPEKNYIASLSIEKTVDCINYWQYPVQKINSFY